MTPNQDLVMASQRRTTDGRIVDMRRRDTGRPLRDAMQARELTIQKLAAKTAEIDPDGRGVNWRTIGFLVSRGSSARETCTIRNADLISRALDVPIKLLFETRISPAYSQAPVSAQRRYEVDVP